MRNRFLLLCVSALIASCGGTEDSLTRDWREGIRDESTANPHPFPDGSSGSSSAAGFVSVSENGRYFQYGDGSPFIPIGHNGYFNTRLFRNQERLNRYFSHLKTHGVNIYRVVLDWYPLATQAVETRVGEFNPIMVEALDNLVEAAEEHGIYLLVALWSGFYENAVTNNWQEHAYNRTHDPVHGLVERPHEILTDEAARAAAKERIRFFVKRWGSSRHIFAWELYNEINATGPQEAQDPWIDEMGAFIRELETDLYGAHHLRTASANNAAFPHVESGIYTSSELDFSSYHTYDPLLRVGVNVFEGLPGISRINPVQYILFIQASSKRALAESVPRPVLGTEDAGIVVDPRRVLWPFSTGFMDYTVDQLDDLFTGSAWASFVSGGAGPSLRWPCNPMYPEDAPEGYYDLSTGMFRAQQAMRRILASVDWTRFAPIPAEENVVTVAGDEVLPMVLKGKGETLLWLLHTDPEFSGAEVQTSVSIRGHQEAAYDVTWYDPRTGNVLQRDVRQGPSFTLSTPAFRTFVTAIASRR